MASIFVLVDPRKTLTSTHVIKTLEKYTSVYVDGKNFLAPDIKHKYGSANGKFFAYDIDKWIMFEVDIVDLIPPAFFVSFPVGQKIVRKQWNLILKWVNLIFDGEDDDELKREVLELLPKFPVLPEKVTVTKQIENIHEHVKNYEFKYEVDGDLAFFQVFKPYTDRPYTAVIRNYSRRGMLPFFTALYVSTSWGVCSNDHAFLQKLWTHLKMDQAYGPLNLEQRLKEDIEKCTPGEGRVPEAEPEVYRLSIMDIKELWSNKQKRLAEGFEVNKRL